MIISKYKTTNEITAKELAEYLYKEINMDIQGDFGIFYALEDLFNGEGFYVQM